MRFGLDFSSLFTFSIPVPSLTASQYIAGMPGAWAAGAQQPIVVDQPHQHQQHQQQPAPQVGCSDQDRATGRRALQKARRAVERQHSQSRASPFTCALERIPGPPEQDPTPEAPRRRSDKERARHAAQKLQAKKLAAKVAPKKRIIKTFKRDTAARPMTADEGPQSFVFVGNIDRFCTPAHLQQFFEKYVGKGNIWDVSIRCSNGVALAPERLAVDVDCLRTKNYALVEFYTASGADMALAADGHLLKGRAGAGPVYVRRRAMDLPFAQLMVERIAAQRAADKHRLAEEKARKEAEAQFLVSQAHAQALAAAEKGAKAKSRGRGAAPVSKTASFLSQQKDKRAKAVDAQRLDRLLKAIKEDGRQHK